MSATINSDQRRLPLWPLALALALGTLILYWPVTECAFINFDDDLYVTANAPVQNGLTVAGLKWDWTHPVASNWHPLTMLSHQLDCQLFGLHPAGHHLTSILLHALNVALVFSLLNLLTRAVWRSLLVAALFAVHPLHVESVAWIAERKDVLSGFFGLLTLIFYAQYARNAKGGRQKPDGGSGDSAYWWALLCFALGLLGKAMLVTWPFVMLLLDYWPLGRFQPGRLRPLLREKIPFLALMVIMSIVTLWVQHQAGAVAAVDSLPAGQRSVNALVSYYRYFAKIIWPTDLTIFYPLPAQWPVIKVLVAVALLSGLSLIFLGKRRSHPFLLMGWLWFLGTLVPVIGLVQVGEQSIADRYTYLPSLGIFIVVVWGATTLTKRWQNQFPALALAGATAVASCAALTWRQIGYWQDSEALFRHDLAVAADNHIARNNLGAALEEKGRLDEAIAEYQQAIQLQAEDPSAHYNLGNAYFKKGDYGAAVSQYQEAISRKPGYAAAFQNLGNAYYKQGQHENAITAYKTAIRIQPTDPTAHYNLGRALFNQGDTQEANSEYQSALRLNPNYADAHNNLGFALQAEGRIAEAISHYQQALRLKPGYALAENNLAAALAAKPSSPGP